MINIVLDTNVLVATLLRPDGVHAHALLTVMQNPHAFQIVVSSQIADEYADVLSREIITFRGLKPQADALLELVEACSQEVIPKAIAHLVYPDMKDKPFVEAAVYVDGLLITNNVRDFPFVGLRALRAGEFLDMCKGLPGVQVL
jgi:predicted nucleic acid-binding protein